VRGIRVAGGTFPAIIWREFMVDALRGTRVKGFKIPEVDLVTLLIDPKTGLLATTWCPGEPKTMLKQVAPTQTCPPPPPPEPEPLPTPSPTVKNEKAKDASPSPEPTGSPKPKPSASG
jgi:membrane carboxypeptidase/penicillin-binding protein